MPDPGQIPASAPLSARLRAVLDEIPALIVVVRGPDHVVEFANVRQRDVTGAASIEGLPAAQVLGASAPAMARYLREMDHVLERGEIVQGWAAPARFPGQAAETYWDYVLVPLRDPGGPPVGVVVHAVEVTRLMEAQHRYQALFHANTVGVTVTGDRDILEANDAFLAMIGRTRDELDAGLRWTELTAAESAEADARAMESLRVRGIAPPYEKEYVRPDGSRVPVLISGSRLRADPLLVLATAYDLGARRAAEREVAGLLERMSRLQAITAGLSATNTPDEIARIAVHQGLEELAASAAMLVRGQRVAHAVGFERDRVAQWERFPATLPAPVAEVLRTRAPVHSVGGPDLPAVASLLAVPLEVTGRLMGALVLAFREPRDLAAADEDFLAALARATATALDRAQLYENRAYVARTLQEGLLPERLAEIPGLEAEVVYRSISGGGDIGGDFYDLFEAAPGRWVLAIGDVSGKGTEAAVVTGLARHTVRAIARVQDSPADVLRFLNGALRRHGRGPAFCTVGCLSIQVDPGGGFALRAASGGHPMPLLVRPHARVDEVSVGGTMLGAADDPDLSDVQLHLRPGEALVAFTDGVTDARRPRGERFGEARLHAALAEAAGASAGGLARAVEAAVDRHAPGTPADDRAIVVLRARI